MKTLLIAVFALMAINSEASVLCHTPRLNKIFEIDENKITFFNEFDSNARRELASVNSRSKLSPQGFTKIVDFENQKHTIHVADVNNLSDLNDYIVIRSRSGHEMTYPLTCENK